jgi:hypothetical protein
MQNDIANLAANTWHDVYALSGIAPGTKIVIYNKGNSTQTYWEGSQPGANDWSGVPIIVNDAAIVDQVNATGCWIKSPAPITINVQVDTQ